MVIISLIAWIIEDITKLAPAFLLALLVCMLLLMGRSPPRR